jgi:hypothetical protein
MNRWELDCTSLRSASTGRGEPPSNGNLSATGTKVVWKMRSLRKGEKAFPASGLELHLFNTWVRGHNLRNQPTTLRGYPMSPPFYVFLYQ